VDTVSAGCGREGVQAINILDRFHIMSHMNNGIESCQPSPIPFEELLEVAKVTVQLADKANQYR
jgi:hypothetical protein